MLEKALFLRDGWTSREMGVCTIRLNAEAVNLEFYGRTRQPVLALSLFLWRELAKSIMGCLSNPDYPGRNFEIADAFPAEQGYPAAVCDIAMYPGDKMIEFTRHGLVVMTMSFDDALAIHDHWLQPKGEQP